MGSAMVKLRFTVPYALWDTDGQKVASTKGAKKGP